MVMEPAACASPAPLLRQAAAERSPFSRKAGVDAAGRATLPMQALISVGGTA
jgi:hypothetical protein